MMSNPVMKPFPRGSAGLSAQLLNVGLGPPNLVNRIIQTPNLLTSQVLTFAPAWNYWCVKTSISWGCLHEADSEQSVKRCLPAALELQETGDGNLAEIPMIARLAGLV